ncbi:MAG: hypothetical protein J1E63_05075 [Muribaculaceae bacterium]|nr:hypothetical protein [Muribaculaceae bacterium]
MKKSYLLLVLIGLCSLLSSCGSGLVVVKPQTMIIDLVNNAVPSNYYNDLTKGLRIEVSSDVPDSKILDFSLSSSKTQKLYNNVEVVVTPTIKTFVSNSLTNYARSMGISVGRDVSNDLILQVRVKEFKYVYDGDYSGRGVIELDYTLMNSNRDVILRQVARGRKSFTLKEQSQTIASIFDQTYTEVLNDIDWNGIANYLKINDRPDQEQSRTVKGEGDTALEHTIIRWYVVSAPAGADVYWRIVSSTPEVKNTNSAFLGSTPYEATESFSVRGLNFENSGNVQVEIVCEKPGYITQSRRFNLRQAIEQREISTKFNLIKDE